MFSANTLKYVQPRVSDAFCKENVGVCEAELLGNVFIVSTADRAAKKAVPLSHFIRGTGAPAKHTIGDEKGGESRRPGDDVAHQSGGFTSPGGLQAQSGAAAIIFRTVLAMLIPSTEHLGVARRTARRRGRGGSSDVRLSHWTIKRAICSRWRTFSSGGIRFDFV